MGARGIRERSPRTVGRAGKLQNRAATYRYGASRVRGSGIFSPVLEGGEGRGLGDCAVKAGKLVVYPDRGVRDGSTYLCLLCVAALDSITLTVL